MDSTRLSNTMTWLARPCAPLSGGFFGLAFFAAFAVLLYLGTLLMLSALLTTGLGLLRGLGATRDAEAAQ